MDNYTATEQAYKNGYEQGLKDAVKEGEWVAPLGMMWNYVCSCCGYGGSDTVFKRNYCPNCGARMKG